ncbi:MAG: hypothetical protein B7Y80_00830 [Hyphomicrobium sp. 32-62-53]|nr:MAG: hypothetical protein B7Z29_14150 [Hyphomicrobium sp. 12-62-95]OYY01891.1 MAG: hypothetical protein B7Y80_00830 [Hyphomicrobium sp. 32-62-53]
MRFDAAARVGVFALSFFLTLPVMAESAAHDIANRFSEPPANVSVKTDDADRKAYEAEMLERARQEAAERAGTSAAADETDESRQRALEAQREAEGRALADKLKRAEEQRRAKAAGAVAKEPAGESTFKPALTNKDILTNKDRAAKPVTDTAKAPVVVKPPVDDAADVARETVPVTPPLQTVQPVTPKIEPPKVVAEEPAKVLPPPMALGRPAPVPPVARVPDDPRVTVLLVMEPGKKGIRRFNKTADPVLCEGSLCFVSNGAAEPARVMAMRKTLGPGNTFGKRAGACRNKLTCVFRGVTLDGAATIQPVDLKVLVHDRREARAVSGDASCRVVAGRLSCGRTVVAAGYRAWIVPERIAEQAGPQALEAAVLRGLVAAPMREAAVTR